MENLSNNKTKVVKVIPWNGEGMSQSEKYFEIPSDIKTDKDNEVILISQKYKGSGKNKTVYEFYLVLQTYEDYDNTLPLTDINGNSINKSVIKPWSVSNVNLKTFFDKIDEQRRLLNIEKQLSDAIKNISFYTQCQQLAEFNDEYKEMFEEYKKLIKPGNNNLLSSGK